MASPNRPARLNRTLLLIVAILLLLVAAFTLLVATGVLARLGLLPSLTADSPLTGAQLSPPTWVPVVALVVAVVLGLLCLRWLLAQAQRRPASGTWRFEDEPGRGAVRLEAQTAVDPLVAEVEGYPGVHRASARLSGPVHRPVLHLVVGTEDAADITDLRRRIDAEAIPRLRQALDLESLPADLLLRLDDARSARLS